MRFVCLRGRGGERGGDGEGREVVACTISRLKWSGFLDPAISMDVRCDWVADGREELCARSCVHIYIYTY